MIFLDFGKITKKDGEIFVLGKFCERVRKDTEISSCRVEELGFSNSMPTSWKKGTLPHIKNRKKIADYFGITVDELMGIQKEPAGQGGLGYEWPEVEEAFKNASPEARAAAKAAALAVLESGKK